MLMKKIITVFWHCGLAPISMAEKNSPSATVHSIEENHFFTILHLNQVKLQFSSFKIRIN